VVHFPEAALSGYARADFVSFDGYDWQTLGDHTHQNGLRRVAHLLC
jgi:hypothetical protein